MYFIPTLLLASPLVCLSVGLVVHHFRSWRQLKDGALEQLEHDYRHRQFRRRLQVSIMLGLVGIGLIVGSLIPPRERPNTFVWFWAGLVGVVFWIMLLALSDALSTKMFVSRVRREHLAEEAQLRAELRRVRAVQGNGHSSQGPETVQ